MAPRPSPRSGIAGIFRRAHLERRLSPVRAPTCATFFLPCLLAAQSPDTAKPAAGSPSAPVVRAVEIRRSDIFDSGETGGLLHRAANGLHYMTREAVVRRELLFREATNPPRDEAGARCR